jgi:hypothetical protein
MNLRTLSFASFFLVACSDTTSPAPARPVDVIDASGEAPDSAATPQPDAGTSPDAAIAAGVKPITPQVTMVMKMGGALHATWKLNDKSLTGVELWRAKDAEPAAKVVGLPGTATSYHDTGASTSSSKYCYQVMTVRAGETSEMSNAVCASP